jgi:subtilase family serine protease
MKKQNRIVPLAAVCLCAAAFVLFTNPMHAQQALQVLHNHVRPAVANGQAVPVGLLPATQEMHLAITLPLRNQSELTALLNRQHDPASPDYRKFLSVEQFTEKFAPTEADFRAVVDFAEANGLTVTNTPPNRLLVDVSGSVAQVDKTFHIVMMVYQHPTEHRTFYSTDRDPSIALSVPILHIEGLDDFSKLHNKMRKAPEGQVTSKLTGSGPGGQYLGSDMRAAYYGNGPLTGAGQSVGLFEEDGYNLSDVTGTFDGESYSVPINNVLIDGASAASDGDDGEQVLDIVQAISMAPGLDQVLFYTVPEADWPAGTVEVDAFNRMATDNICKQISSSWGWNPNDISSLNDALLELAIQGQTVFDATGDTGALTGNNAADNYLWPGDDDYLIAVGATDLTTTGPGGAWVSETAWSNSNGGPSDNGIPIPAWQVPVINSSNQGSTTLRNVPDVAMEGNFDNYLCDEGSCGGGIGGTSYAAPRWAGFMALVNQQAALVGYPSLGFIDPDIYAIGEGSSYTTDFHDIVSGNNDCCGQTTFWTAVPGYDLVTGWGSPNGANLIDALVRVAPPTIGSANAATFQTGVFGSFQVSATGLPSSTFTESGALPHGLSLSPSGLLSGTPSAGTGGIYNITLTADNNVAPNGTQAFTLTVGQAPQITSANHATFEAGVFGSFQVTANGFPATSTFSTGGPLPSGVGLSSSGLLSGIPAAGGTFTFTITASNGFTPNATQVFTLTVSKAASTCAVATSSSLFSNGVPVTLTATISPVAPATFTPTGTVSFVDSGSSLHTLGTAPVVGGVATLTTKLKSPPVVQYVKAVYSGSAAFVACQSTFIAESSE